MLAKAAVSMGNDGQFGPIQEGEEGMVGGGGWGRCDEVMKGIHWISWVTRHCGNGQDR